MRVLRALLVLIALAGMTLPFKPVRESTVQDTRKRIALSFDDVPRAPGAFYTKDERTRRLIAALHEAGVRQAAFFLNPGRIAAHDGAEERIQAYVAAGHVIADHSFSHRDLSSTSAPAFLADIDKAEDWLQGRPGYRPWFRFPGLNQGGRDVAKRRAVLAGLEQRHLLVAAVTVDGSDWNLERLTLDAVKSGKPVDLPALRDLYVETMVQSADFSDALMRRAIGRSPAHVLLLHETDLAARYVGALVTALEQDGWVIVPADTAYADPVYHFTPDTSSPNATLTEALAAAKGITGPIWYDRNDMKVADALFEARIVHLPVSPPAPVPLLAARAGPVIPAVRPISIAVQPASRHRECLAWHRTHRRFCGALGRRARPAVFSGSPI